MIIKYMAVGPLMANCYILGDEESRESVVIDPGGDADQIASVLAEDGLRLTAIVNTHGHWDHTYGNEELKRLAGGTILIHALEAVNGFIPDGYLAEGDRVKFGPYELEVRETPGHSPGSISLYLPEVEAVFVGDLLFAGSVGRTDFGGGSHQVLLASVREKIFTLPDQTRVLPGHGPLTTVGQEKRFNPFFQGDI